MRETYEIHAAQRIHATHRTQRSKKVLAFEETEKRVSEHFYADSVSETISGTL
jgi:hypothetical protein